MDGLLEKTEKNAAPIVDFASINGKTNLEALNMDWAEKDLPENIRTKNVHRLHPYMGKFIPQLVEIFLRKYSPNLVYDPFCGSGTTLVEAKALGINSVGSDISVFNVLLSKVKTNNYNIEAVEMELHDILARVHELKNGGATKRTSNDYLNAWFAQPALQDILLYRDLIPEYKYSDLLRIILSRSARSARRVSHFELDFPKKPQTEPYYCYKHRRECKPTEEVYKFLTRYSIDTLERLRDYSEITKDATADVMHSDSRLAKLPSNIDLVFTSPPYVGLIDYHEQHRYAYEILGLDDNSDREIGPAFMGQSENAKKAYIDGINSVIEHTRDSMAPNGKMVIVVNDKYGLYSAKKVGFKEITRLSRDVNRRTGRRNTNFSENILIWEKV